MSTPAISDLEGRVRAVIEDFRPATQAHGGDVEFVRLTPERIVHVRLTGACHGCPHATMTLQMGLEQLLRVQAPEVGGVENVNT